jgi:hypothetical protein
MAELRAALLRDPEVSQALARWSQTVRQLSLNEYLGLEMAVSDDLQRRASTAVQAPYATRSRGIGNR